MLLRLSDVLGGAVGEQATQRFGKLVGDCSTGVGSEASMLDFCKSQTLRCKASNASEGSFPIGYQTRLPLPECIGDLAPAESRRDSR